MPTVFNSNLLNDICSSLATDGYAVIDDAFPVTFMTDLQLQVKSIEAGQFKLAGIGRAVGFQTNSQIRSDEIMWLDESRAENQSYFSWVETLRLTLNQRFYLGCAEYECMFAHYPVGAFYQKHVDTFSHTAVGLSSHRKVSTILYLNPNWQPDDGGELLLYRHGEEQPFKRVLPELGRLAVFLSEEFPHEVLPAKRPRYSLTGWYKTKS